MTRENILLKLHKWQWGSDYVICNVYAPKQNYKHDQNNFAIKLKNILAPFSNFNIILAGDFNTLIHIWIKWM